jgi:hypothetical protein
VNRAVSKRGRDGRPGDGAHRTEMAVKVSLRGQAPITAPCFRQGRPITRFVCEASVPPSQSYARLQGFRLSRFKKRCAVDDRHVVKCSARADTCPTTGRIACRDHPGADGVVIATDGSAECGNRQNAGKRDQACEQRVLDQILALLLPNEAVEQIRHATSPIVTVSGLRCWRRLTLE